MNQNKSDLNLIFPTPVWTSMIQDHKLANQKLYDYIKSLQNEDPKGIYRSNINGWHSKNFDLQNESVIFFLNSISSNLNKAITDLGWDLNKNKMKITSMWSIINNKSSSNSRHMHSNNFISAAYYLKAPKNCGDIVFHDPREAKLIRKPITSEINNLNTEIINIEPKEGLLVLFPSYLHHSVNSNNSDDERIVISFNIDFIY